MQLKTRGSLDSLEKAQLPPERAKEEKKRKEKKGMLSGLFKRKDRKHRGQEDDTEDYEKLSEELLRDSSQPKEWSESSSQDAQAPKSVSQQPQRQSSKLQKTPPAKHTSGKPPPRTEQKGALVEQSTVGPQPNRASPDSPILTPRSQPDTTRPSNDIPVQHVVSPEQFRDDSIDSSRGTLQETRASDETSESSKDVRQETRARDGTSESPMGTRYDMFSRARDGTSESPMGTRQDVSSRVSNGTSESPMGTRQDMFSRISNGTSESPLGTRQELSSRVSDGTSESPRGTRHEVHVPASDGSYESRPEKLRIPKQRMPLDEFDSSPDTAEPPDPLTKKDQGSVKTEAPKERLSESPVQVDLPERLPTLSPPHLVVDTSSQKAPSASPVSPPEIIEAPRYNDREETPVSTTQSPSITPTWSDASLRAYLEDDGDIRDLLVVVHDKSNVKPADPDHPLVKNLFKEEHRKLGEISDQLDSLLGDWLARKSKLATR